MAGPELCWGCTPSARLLWGSAACSTCNGPGKGGCFQGEGIRQSQLRGNTERCSTHARVMHACYFGRELICPSPKAHDTAETVLLSSVSPHRSWESFTQSQTPQMCLYSWLQGAKRVGQPKHVDKTFCIQVAAVGVLNSWHQCHVSGI